jgi:hypothetical protein
MNVDNPIDKQILSKLKDFIYTQCIFGNRVRDFSIQRKRPDKIFKQHHNWLLNFIIIQATYMIYQIRNYTNI